MNQVKDDEIRQHVRNRYKQIAVENSSDTSCCSPNPQQLAAAIPQMKYHQNWDTQIKNCRPFR